MTTFFSSYTPNADDSIDLSAPRESTRVLNEGATSITAGDSQAEHHGRVTKHTMSFEGQAGGSVVDTLQRYGAAHTVELVPGQPGSRTNVQSAIRAGLIEADGRGGFRDTGTQAEAVRAVEATAAPQEEPAAFEVAQAFNPRELAAWNQDIAPLEQHAYDSSVARTVEAAVSGGSLDTVIEQLAKNAGLERADAASFVSEGVAMYTRAVERELARVGIVGQDLQPFYAYLRSEEPQHLRHALQKVALTHDTSEFKRLGSKWQQTRMRRGG